MERFAIIIQIIESHRPVRTKRFRIPKMICHCTQIEIHSRCARSSKRKYRRRYYSATARNRCTMRRSKKSATTICKFSTTEKWVKILNLLKTSKKNREKLLPHGIIFVSHTPNYNMFHSKLAPYEAVSVTKHFNLRFPTWLLNWLWILSLISRCNSTEIAQIRMHCAIKHIQKSINFTLKWMRTRRTRNIRNSEMKNSIIIINILKLSLQHASPFSLLRTFDVAFNWLN